MGNLVTNRITLSAPNGPLSDELRDRLLDTLSPLGAPEALARIEGKEEGEWVPLSFQGIVPEPESIRALTEDGSHHSELGLALLSDATTDWVRQHVKHDSIEELLGVDEATTRISILQRHGLLGLEGEALRAAGEALKPGSLEAGQAAIRAIEETGYSTWLQWREAKWGTRCDMEDGRVWLDEEGSLNLRFDTVNAVPMPVITELAKAFPDLQIMGAGIDEDTDYSVTFVTGEPGKLDVYESHDSDDLESAYETIYGHARPNYDTEDEEPKDDEDMDKGDRFEP